VQEYGSVYESTTCDEHDDYDEAGGLRAWHTGMATALWPSYAHVYAPNTAAASSSGGLVLPHTAATTGDLLPTGSARAGAAARMLRATHSEFGGGSAAAAAGSAGADTALARSSAGLRGLHALPPSAVGAAMGASRGHSMMLPTVYEAQQPPQQQQGLGQEGLGRPPLPVHAAGGAAAVLSPCSLSGADLAASSSSAAACSSGGRAATIHMMAAARGGIGRVVFRSRSTNSLHHSGRHRPRSAGSTSSSGGSSSTAGTAAMLRPWSAGAEGRESLEAHAASLEPGQASSQSAAVAEQFKPQNGS
jgi:hypothetical protein